MQIETTDEQDNSASPTDVEKGRWRKRDELETVLAASSFGFQAESKQQSVPGGGAGRGSDLTRAPRDRVLLPPNIRQKLLGYCLVYLKLAKSWHLPKNQANNNKTTLEQIETAQCVRILRRRKAKAYLVPPPP